MEDKDYLEDLKDKKIEHTKKGSSNVRGRVRTTKFQKKKKNGA